MKKATTKHAPVRKKYKPLPMGITALRNFVMFLLAFGLVLSVLLIGGNDLHAFYNKKHFEKYATITSEFTEEEGKWGTYTEHTITLAQVSTQYQYVAAVMDLSKYESEQCTTNGTIRINYRAISNRQQLEHILFLNPTHPIEDESDDVIIYTNDETFNKNFGYHSAEEFYSLQEKYEEEHATLFAILQNDFDHIMYNLVQGSGWRWAFPVLLFVLCVIYAVVTYKKRSEMCDDGISTINILWGVSLLATSVGIMCLALVGGVMHAEGGVGEIVVTVVSIVTGLCALLFVFSMLLPLLLDIDFAYGFSVFWIKILASFLVAALVFGLGVMLEALMEEYAIFQTALMILLVFVALMSFFAFMSFLAARSVIFKTYMDISLKTCEILDRAGGLVAMIYISAEIAKAEQEYYKTGNYFAKKKMKQLDEVFDEIANNLNNNDQ